MSQSAGGKLKVVSFTREENKSSLACYKYSNGPLYFLQTVSCSLAVEIVTKISFSENNGILWLKMEAYSCLLLFQEIRYVKRKRARGNL